MNRHQQLLPKDEAPDGRLVFTFPDRQPSRLNRTLPHVRITGHDALHVDESGLLQAVAAGDERAIEGLYDAFADRLYGFGLRLLGDAGLAEELVQETFVRIWQQARRFDPSRGAARTFVFTLARRLAIDLWRRPSSRRLELAREEHAPGHAEHVVNSVVVSQALASVSPDHREVLELLHFQQLTQSEAAAVLDIPLGTVKTRAYHAVRAMKKALEEHGIDA